MNTSLKEIFGICCTHFLRKIVSLKRATVTKATLQVLSSWLRKQQFALGVAKIIIRDSRDKQDKLQRDY